MHEKNIKVVVIVSPDMSDIYFANRLICQLNVVGVFVENQDESSPLSRKLKKAFTYAVMPWRIPGKVRSDKIFSDHYRKTYAIDVEQFGEEGKGISCSHGCKVVYTEGKNAINDPLYVNQIKALNPDVIAVSGSSILRKELISVPSLGTLNLHGGLSQKYRGIWTTLWAIYNEEPEYVGCTVHYVSEGIDDGKIIYQGRPEIDEKDDPETLYVKVVKLGSKLMVKAVRDIEKGTVKSTPPEILGKLYLIKNVTAHVLEKTWENINNGVITKYLENKKERDTRVVEMLEKTAGDSL